MARYLAASRNSNSFDVAMKYAGASSSICVIDHIGLPVDMACTSAGETIDGSAGAEAGATASTGASSSFAGTSRGAAKGHRAHHGDPGGHRQPDARTAQDAQVTPRRGEIEEAVEPGIVVAHDRLVTTFGESRLKPRREVIRRFDRWAGCAPS